MMGRSVGRKRDKSMTEDKCTNSCRRIHVDVDSSSTTSSSRYSSDFRIFHSIMLLLVMAMAMAM